MDSFEVLLEGFPEWPISDDDLGSGRFEGEKVTDIFLHSDPSDEEEDRFREIEKEGLLSRREDRMIDSEGDDDDFLFWIVIFLEVELHRSARDDDMRSMVVDKVEGFMDIFLSDKGNAERDILRELRMKC